METSHELKGMEHLAILPALRRQLLQQAMVWVGGEALSSSFMDPMGGSSCRGLKETVIYVCYFCQEYQLFLGEVNLALFPVPKSMSPGSSGERELVVNKSEQHLLPVFFRSHRHLYCLD